MTRTFVRGAAAAAFLLLAACSSDGARARRWQAGMFEDVPPGSDAKVVVLRVPDPGQFTPSERTLFHLRNMPGVLTVRRGAGEDEVYALVDGVVSPEALVNGLALRGDRAWVVRVVTSADVAAASAKE